MLYDTAPPGFFGTSPIGNLGEKNSKTFVSTHLTCAEMLQIMELFHSKVMG